MATMKLYLVAKTSIKDLVIDFIEIINEKGKTLTLNWSKSSMERRKDGFEAYYENVVSGEDEIFCMDDLSEMRVVYVELYSDTKKVLDIQFGNYQLANGTNDYADETAFIYGDNPWKKASYYRWRKTCALCGYQ